MRAKKLTDTEAELQMNPSRMTAMLWDMEIVSGDSAFQLGQQLTNSYTLLILLSGAGKLERGTQVCKMRPDSVYICPPDSTFGVTGRKQEELALVLIRFGLFQLSSKSRERMQAVLSDGLLPSGEDVTVDPAGRLTTLCRSMYEHFRNDDPLKRWRAQIEFQELLYEVMVAARRKPKEDTRHALERSRHYIEEHFGEDLTIDCLAGIAGLSPKYFVDLFKKTYGVSALDYLTQIRIAKAKQLMLGSDRLLRDIAHEVGYVDEFYFSRKFKKEVGMSPSAFIKKRKHKVAVYGSTSLIGYLMPLHIVPYAAPLHPKWSRYYYDLLGADIPVHLDAFRQNQNKEANLEKLAASQPELIICPAGLEAWEKQRLLEIAPVFELPEEEQGWRALLLAVAKRLEEQTQAEKWIAELERKMMIAREQIGRHGQPNSVLTVRLREDSLSAHRNRGITEVLYTGLGLQAPDPLEETPFNVPITVEELEASGADTILLLVWQESGTLARWKELQLSPHWLSLTAVRENKLHLIGSEPWREYSPIALERMLEEAVQLLSGNRP